MEYKKLHTITFSATNTTHKVVEEIKKGSGLASGVVIDLSKKNPEIVTFPEDEVVIIGVPVYSGRVPAFVAERLKSFYGKHTPVFLVCVYGNRDFDDALIELYDIAVAQGFCPVSAAAFVAEHSIFPKVATSRPDEADLQDAFSFGTASVKILNQEHPDMLLKVPGNRPYRAVKSIPLKLRTKRSCNSCGRCARECPVQAIDANRLRQTDTSRCVLCMHCVQICPQHARHLGGLLYWLASRKFTRTYTNRRSPLMLYKTMD